jgi:hypothetical protein
MVNRTYLNVWRITRDKQLGPALLTVQVGLNPTGESRTARTGHLGKTAEHICLSVHYGVFILTKLP